MELKGSWHVAIKHLVIQRHPTALSILRSDFHKIQFNLHNKELNLAHAVIYILFIINFLKDRVIQKANILPCTHKHTAHTITTIILNKTNKLDTQSYMQKIIQ